MCWPSPRNTHFSTAEDQNILFSILIYISSKMDIRILMFYKTAYLDQNRRFSIQNMPKRAMLNLLTSTDSKHSRWKCRNTRTCPVQNSMVRVQPNIQECSHKLSKDTCPGHSPTEVPLFFRFSSPRPSSPSSESPSLSSAGSSGSRGGSYRAVFNGKYRSSSGEYLNLERSLSFFL